MRIALAGALFLAALAGCNQRSGNAQTNEAGGLPMPGPRPTSSAGAGGDQYVRQAYRRANVEGCMAAARARSERERNSALGRDFRPYCECAIDRLMEGRSIQELSSLRPGPREQQAAEQCGREHGMLIDSGPGSR